MIPLIAALKLPGVPVRIWLPLFLLWILLAPLVLILFPFFLIACLVTLINPIKALKIFWEILCGLRGTKIDVENGSQQFKIELI